MASIESYVADLRQQIEAQEAAVQQTRAALTHAEDWIQRVGVSQTSINPERQPEEPPHARQNVPSASKLVQVVLAESDRTWSAVDMHQEISRRGWRTDSANPLDVVRTALARSVTREVAERAGEGVYRRKQTESHDESAEDAVAVAAPTASSSPSLNGTGLPWHEGASTP